MQVRIEKCQGCGACVNDCPQAAIKLVKRKAFIGDACSQCGACLKVCPEDALFPEDAPGPNAVSCEACPIRCSIKEGYTGACQRFINRAGVLERTISLKSFEEVRQYAGPDWDPVIRQPLITGIGAGTTYPDCKPAPHVVQSTVDGIDVVTVVTEAPLSYSGIKLKIDTDTTIGEEGCANLFPQEEGRAPDHGRIRLQDALHRRGEPVYRHQRLDRCPARVGSGKPQTGQAPH